MAAMSVAECPICSKPVSVNDMNDHLDKYHFENAPPIDCSIDNESDIQDKESQSSIVSTYEDKGEVETTDNDVEIQEVKVIQKSGLDSTSDRKAISNSNTKIKRSSSSLNGILTGNGMSSHKKMKHEETSAITPTSTPTPIRSGNDVNGPNIKQLKLDSTKPLAEILRPKTLDDYVGQEDLVGPDGLLRGFIENDRVPSLILWGPPGVGKTSIARIISTTSSSRFVEISATSNNTADIKKIFEDSKNEMKLMKRRTILFCDEIHRFNKGQQDIFLPYVERGDIVLIGATTENPSFQLNNALLSRCRTFVLQKLTIKNICKILNKGLLTVNRFRKYVWNQDLLVLNKESIDYLSDLSDGDSRSALNLLEILNSHFKKPEVPNSNRQIKVTIDQVQKILKKTHMIYDRVGDSHYDTISAFHKSIRGSNPDAAMYYLARMLKGGENPLYIARRMIRIASEDVGGLDDSCLPFAVAAYQAVQFVGLPEADLALAHCCVKLAKAPKSVEIYKAWGEINSKMSNDNNFTGASIPIHLRNAPTRLMKELGYGKEYKYNPNFKDGRVKQDYFPESIGETKFLTGKHLGDMIDEDLDG